MKIAILGTKGIPNNYGGFEQFAEEISKRLVLRGHSVTVYNPSFHNYSLDNFNGIRIKKVFDPEKIIGGAANFIYDYLCLKDALKADYDIIYEAGYHSVALSYLLLNIREIKEPIILTNMDGLEWKRSKWNPIVRKLIKFLEKVVVRNCDYLIADNKGIQQYYLDQFNKESYFIPYGATIVEEFDQDILKLYDLKASSYNLIIARLEPENNIEIILQAYISSSTERPLVVIGNFKTKYGKYLKLRYVNNLIKFLGGIYNKAHIDTLRRYSVLYFHGHSVGGTNPSLLEAMACGSFIAAHDNIFNKSVLGENALYFTNEISVRKIIDDVDTCKEKDHFVAANLEKIKKIYDWEKIVDKHEELFKRLKLSS